MLKVFLSSTYEDLVDERQAVQAAIQRMSAQFIGMEYFGSFAEEPLDRCLSKVGLADVLIMILGYRYGFVPEGKTISMTEAEYREANDRGIPTLAYMVDDKHYSPPPDEDARLAKLKEEIKFKRGVSWFTTPEDLAWKVVCDLAREFSHHIAAEAITLETLSNQILISPIENQIDELIDILENRAQKIWQDLQPHYKYAPVMEYLVEFQYLHERHINSLREGNVIQAHELLQQIHELSFKLEMDEYFKEPREPLRGHYMLIPPDYSRGNMACMYFAGEMKKGDRYSYDIHPYPYEEHFAKWRNGVPSAAIRLYKKIVATVPPNKSFEPTAS